MRPRTPVRLVLVVLGILALVGVAGVAVADGTERTATQTDTALADTHIQECAAVPPDDFADPDGDTSDVIGWVDGYWYNEPLDIDSNNGLTQAELDELAARTAARFEAMRCLTADEVPPVEIQTREAFENGTAEAFADIPEDERLFDNAQFETLLAIDSATDSVDLREANRAATVGGFYNFAENRIVVVSDSPESLRIDEEVLAHEIGHAIQDQRFDLSRYERDTTDLDKGTLGLIEGDVDRVEYQYLQACEEGLWDEPCVQEEFDGAGPGEPASWALYFKSFQPYSDGPAFVQHIYDEGGWDAVNALYDDPPGTSTEVIYPRKYGDFETVDITVPDRSGDEWERLTFEESPDYNVLGQAGITSTFMQVPYLDQQRAIIQPRAFLNRDAAGGVDGFNPLNYAHDITDGWRNDRLYAYHDGEATGTVWKTAWNDADNATDFADAYGELVAFRGGERHDEFANVYTFENAENWELTVAVQVEDDRMWVVTAPTVDELTAVHGDVELVEADDGEETTDDGQAADDDTADGQDTGDADDEREANDTADDAAADNDGPGFGVAAAMAGLVGVLLLARRVRQ